MSYQDLHSELASKHLGHLERQREWLLNKPSRTPAEDQLMQFLDRALLMLRRHEPRDEMLLRSVYDTILTHPVFGRTPAQQQALLSSRAAAAAAASSSSSSAPSTSTPAGGAGGMVQQPTQQPTGMPAGVQGRPIPAATLAATMEGWKIKYSGCLRTRYETLVRFPEEKQTDAMRSQADYCSRILKFISNPTQDSQITADKLQSVHQFLERLLAEATQQQHHQAQQASAAHHGVSLSSQQFHAAPQPLASTSNQRPPEQFRFASPQQQSIPVAPPPGSAGTKPVQAMASSPSPSSSSSSSSTSSSSTSSSQAAPPMTIDKTLLAISTIPHARRQLLAKTFAHLPEKIWYKTDILARLAASAVATPSSSATTATTTSDPIVMALSDDGISPTPAHVREGFPESSRSRVAVEERDVLSDIGGWLDQLRDDDDNSLHDD
ncbi:MAG: hypothetical protein Q8P67_04345 [archaeon]|nr:hypothetical protein [archaeon]